MLTVVSVLGHVAPAATTTAEAAASFGAAADTFALQSQPNTQHGSTGSIQVASAAGSPTSIGYMRFDLSGLSGTVTNATLSIYTTSSSAYGVDVHAVADSNWQESRLTWSNRPAYAPAVTANSGPLVSGTRTTIDVTSIVQGDATPSLALTSADPFATLNLRSRESHSRAPRLDVTVAAADTQPPSAPTGLTPTVADSSSIGVVWNGSTDDIGVAGYDVYLNGAFVDTTTATGWSLTGLSCGTSYTISVDAYDGSGNHSAATPLTASTTSCLASTPDFSADPNVTGTLLPWDKFDPGNAASTDGISVSSQPSGANSPGVVAIANDPLGQQGKVFQETVTPTAQASTSSRSDATYLFNYAKPFLGANGEDNWVHFRMMLPAGYEPTAGEWNIFNEFHNNTNFMSFYNSGLIGWEYPEIALYVTNYTGDVPHLMYRVRGGVDDSDNFEGSDFLVPAQLQLDHWYDIMLHVVWSPSATTGLFEWWLDGTRIASVHRPTLWQRPDGSTDHVELELNNYRQHATWNTTVYYSKLETGASRAAVDF